MDLPQKESRPPLALLTVYGQKTLRDAVPSLKNSSHEIKSTLQMSLPHARENSVRDQPRPRFAYRGYLFIAVVGTIVTLATGWLATTVLFSPGGFISRGYGFPFAWKEVDASCPPPCIQANGTFYDWFAFAGDLIFFMAATFAIFYYLLPKSQALQGWFRSKKLLGLLTLVVVALAAGNFAYDSVYGTGNHWTGYGRFALDQYSFQNLNMLTLWIIDNGPGTVTLTNLSITDSVGSRASFPISVFIDQSTIASIVENTTSQGLHLVQNGVYSVEIISSQNVQTTFTVTWT
jgi:hypothetical protein